MYNNPQRRRSAWPTWAIVLLMGGIFLAWLAYDYANCVKIADQYHHAPGCGATGAKIDSALPPCTLKPYTVADAYHYETGGRSSTTHWMIAARSADGDSQSVELDDRALWSRLNSGDAIKLQLWQGKSRVVYAHGWRAPTVDNPDLNRDVARRILIFVGSTDIVALALLLYVAYLRYNLRRRTQVTAPQWYAAPSPTQQALTMAPPGAVYGSQPAANPFTQFPKAGQSARSIAGTWHGMYGYTSSDLPDTPFLAVFEVDETGAVRGTITDQNRLGEATVAGEQQGNQVRFVKKYARKQMFAPSGGIEYQGTLAPDGQTLGGSWVINGRFLGIPVPTQGPWSATRAPGQGADARTLFGTAQQ